MSSKEAKELQAQLEQLVADVRAARATLWALRDNNLDSKEAFGSLCLCLFKAGNFLVDHASDIQFDSEIVVEWPDKGA